jgi:hypothetical protein
MTNYNDGPFTYENAIEHFLYNSETGIFTSASNRRNVHIGDVVGSPDKQGYLITTLFKKPVKLHRLAWLMINKEWPNGQIDHINGTKSDNRIANLRVVSNRQNKQNMTAPSSNTSGYLGVSYHKKSGKWAANIKLDGRSIYLGIYENPEDASLAYKEAKSKFHPFNEVYK